MMYIALTNQMCDDYSLVMAGYVIPDKALSDASIVRLLELGLIQQVSDDAPLDPPALPDDCKGCDEE